MSDRWGRRRPLLVGTGRLRRRHRAVRPRPHRRTPHRLPAAAGPRRRGRHRDRPGRRPRPLRRRRDGPLLLHPDADLRRRPDRRARSSAARSCGSPTGGASSSSSPSSASRSPLVVWTRLPETLAAGRTGTRGGVGEALRTMRGLLADRVFTGYMLAGGFAFAALFAYVSRLAVRRPGDLRRLPADLQPALRPQLGRPGRRRPDQRQAAGRPGQPGQGRSASAWPSSRSPRPRCC